MFCHRKIATRRLSPTIPINCITFKIFQLVQPPPLHHTAEMLNPTPKPDCRLRSPIVVVVTRLPTRSPSQRPASCSRRQINAACFLNHVQKRERKRRGGRWPQPSAIVLSYMDASTHPRLESRTHQNDREQSKKQRHLNAQPLRKLTRRHPLRPSLTKDLSAR